MWVSLWQNVVPETPTELGKTSKKLLSALGFFFLCLSVEYSQVLNTYVAL